MGNEGLGYRVTDKSTTSQACNAAKRVKTILCGIKATHLERKIAASHLAACFTAEAPCPVLVYVLQERYWCLGNGAMRIDYRIEKLLIGRWGSICLPDQKKVKLNLNSTTLVLTWSTDWFFFNVCPADKTLSFACQVPSLGSWKKRNQTRNKANAVFLGNAFVLFFTLKVTDYFNYLPTFLSALLWLEILKVHIFLKAML